MSLSSWQNVESTFNKDIPQFSLPIIVNVSHPDASHEDAILAVARGIALLLDEERASVNGEWRSILEAWTLGDIRKVVRRAKGVAWDKVQLLPGVLSSYGKVQSRILLPHPSGERPIKEVARLQLAVELDSKPRPEEPLHPGTLLVALNPDVAMTTGKAAAQAGHVAHLAATRLPEGVLSAWADSGYSVELTDWNKTESHSLHIVDAGYTEVPAGTITARGTFYL